MAVDYRKIGERMHTLRDLKKISIAEMEKATNFTAKSILLAENGRAALNIDFLIQICDALGVTPNDILVGQYKTPDPTAQEKDALIEGFLLKIEEMRRTGQADSRTKIKDTNTAIDEIEAMLRSQKREQGRKPFSPPSITKDGKYF